MFSLIQALRAGLTGAPGVAQITPAPGAPVTEITWATVGNPVPWIFGNPAWGDGIASGQVQPVAGAPAVGYPMPPQHVMTVG